MQSLTSKDYYSRERFFPEDHRSFCSGELSIAVDRFGGIENLTYIHCIEHNGKLYPARKPIEYFSRNGLNLGRPFICPGIRSVCEYSDGSVEQPFPEYPEIYPNGTKTDNYELVLGFKCFSLKTKVTQAMEHRFLLTACKLHYTSQKELSTVYNQLAREDVWLPPQYRGEEFDPNKPFADGVTRIDYVVPRLDKEANAVIFCKKLQHPSFSTPLYCVITSELKLNLDEKKNDWVISTECTGEQSIVFAVALDEDLDTALKRCKACLKHHDNAMKEMYQEEYENGNAPDFRLENYPMAEHFAKIFPAYQRRLICAETRDSATIRAAYMKYGFFPIWDHIYPIRDFLVANEHKLARKCLEYMVDYPHWDTNPFVLMHLCIALDEYLAFTGDDSLLKEFYPKFKISFAFAETLVSRETGLIRYGIDTAVDKMEELGLYKLFYASCVNGWWYDACCCLINFAKDMKDRAFEEKVAGYEALISKNYEEVFFDRESGYIRTAVSDKGKFMSYQVPLHTKSLPMDYANGSWLFRRIMPKMSSYLMKRHLHPWGVTAVPYDCEAPCIYLRGTRMNQHLGHSCKMLRQSNCVKGVEHLLNGYMYVFKQTECAVETFNYSYCSGDQSQRADWQAFSATAAVQAIVQGALGLFWHRGGICYVAANETGDNAVRNFAFGSRKWDIAITGSGGGVSSMTINGKELVGTLQIPQDMCDGSLVDVKIARGEPADARPTLLYAIGVSIRDVKSDRNSLQFKCSNDCRGQFAVQCANGMVAFLDGKPVPSEYSEDNQRLWFTADIQAGSLIEIK